jgi:hypothetical protein
MLRVVFSSSKVMIKKSFPLFSWFFTPSTFFRIEPILAFVFQAEQPGTVNCTIISLARAIPPKDANKMKVKNTLNIFFIFHLILVFWLYNNSKSFPEANTIYN